MDRPAETRLPKNMTMNLRTLSSATALACAANAGVLLAFSTFVMAGLRKLPAAQGLVAMQKINITAEQPAFMTLFMGTALACAALAVYCVLHWNEPHNQVRFAAALIYLIGTFGLTVGYHVPMNNRLALLDPHAAGSAQSWISYARSWTAWNHVRAGFALASAATFLVAARV